MSQLKLRVSSTSVAAFSLETEARKFDYYMKSNIFSPEPSSAEHVQTTETFEQISAGVTTQELEYFN